MTLQQVMNRELSVGDFVKFTAGGEASRQLIWLVVGIDYENLCRKQAVVRLRLVEGTWIDYNKTPGVPHEVGFERTVLSGKLKKIDVVIKEKVSA